MTTKIRKTKSIESYVRLSDEISDLSRRLKLATATEKAMRADMVELLPADGVIVRVDGRERQVLPERKESTRPAVEAPELIAFAESAGLPVAERDARWIPPATFSSWCRQGIVPESLIDRTAEIVVIVR